MNPELWLEGGMKISQMKKQRNRIPDKGNSMFEGVAAHLYLRALRFEREKVEG